MDFDGNAFWEFLPENTTGTTPEAYRNFLDCNIKNWKNSHNERQVLIAHDNA